MSTQFEAINSLEFPQLTFLKTHLEGHAGFIAGGCFKNIFEKNKIKDIDMFFKSQEHFDAAVRFFTDNSEYESVYETNSVMAFRHHDSELIVECVKSRFGDVPTILNMFDFTVTKFALVSDSAKPTGLEILLDDVEPPESHSAIYHPKFFEHLVLRRAVIDDNLLLPFSTFNRALRYAKYGYTLCKDSRLKLIDAMKITELPEDLDEAFASLYEGID